MSTLPNEFLPPRAEQVRVTRDSLVVDLQDGRTITVPLSWYARLHHGLARERANWRLIAGGEGIHWLDLVLARHRRVAFAAPRPSTWW